MKGFYMMCVVGIILLVGASLTYGNELVKKDILKTKVNLSNAAVLTRCIQRVESRYGLGKWLIDNNGFWRVLPMFKEKATVKQVRDVVGKAIGMYIASVFKMSVSPEEKRARIEEAQGKGPAFVKAILQDYPGLFKRLEEEGHMQYFTNKQI